MRKSGLCLAIILITASFPVEAIENGFFLGGSIGGSSVEVRDFDEELGDIRFSGDGTAYKLFAGFRFLNFLAVEAGYVNLGDSDDVSDVVGSTVGNPISVGIGLNGWDAFAVGLLPIGPVDLFAKVGVVSWDAEIRARPLFTDVVETDSESGTDAAYGIGIGVRLGKMAIRAEGEQFKIADTDDVYLFSIGVTFTF